jgi:putative endonuclease
MSEGAIVYLLACGDTSLYCGWTTDLERRLARHSAGLGAAYTRSRLPVRVAAAWRCSTPAQARSLEARVKRLPRATKLALVSGGLALDEACGIAGHVRGGAERLVL